MLLQDFLEDVAPLISMQLGGHTLDGLSLVFDQYIDMLIKAVPSPGEDDEGTENGDERKVFECRDSRRTRPQLLAHF